MDLEENSEDGSYSTGYEDENGSESGSESASGTSSSGEGSEEEEEPVLKYKRFAKELVNSINGAGGDRNIICCIAVHPKFIALGTYDGTIKLLDHAGTFLKDRVYHLHSAQINQISVDDEGEIMGSCANDGKVSLVGLFTARYNNTFSFDRHVKSLAVHPNFSRGANHVFVIGTDRLVMIEERRWPMGNKTTELHCGAGLITTIKWREHLIAWANERMVMVYDTSIRERIASISFDEESPIPLPCSLYWQSTGTLLVGRGHLVKIATVKEGEIDEQPVSYSGEVEVSLKRRRHMTIVAQNTFAKFLVCGVVPLFDSDQRWKLVVLGYDAEIDQIEATQNGTVPPPHLVVVSPGLYNPEQEAFDSPEDVSRDKLLPKAYSYCRCDEYHLECILGEDRLYIFAPLDSILAEKRDVNDHIDWLLKKRDFEGAMQSVENPRVGRLLHPGKLQEIGIQYIYHLLNMKKYEEAAKQCSEMLGSLDKKRWEDIIICFLEAQQLPALLPFIPTSEPRLSPAIYELVLNTFLQEDCQMLYKVIETWETSLYNPQAIINAVQDRLKQDPGNRDLMKVKAKLHEDLEQYEEALKIYLQQGHTEVFELIQKRKLYAALVENLILLMRLGTKQAVKLLIDSKTDVQPQRVVKELESAGSQKLLHQYLDGLFERDPKAGAEYHERQVDLYAQYDPDKLLPFLRSCNDIPLQKALQVCEHYKRYEEMVYLLARMGNPKAALELIISKLQDVDKAIEFAMEEGDEELWEVLISLSIHKPKFITGLLNNVGTHIDPTRLIQKIPDRTEIPDLGVSLVKLLQDFRVQVNLREGCKKILVKDSHKLMEKLHRMQSRPVYIDDEAICRTCGGEVIGMETSFTWIPVVFVAPCFVEHVMTDEDSEYVVFFCGHIYHWRCVPKRNEMMTCRLCYAGSRTVPKRSEGMTHRVQRL